MWKTPTGSTPSSWIRRGPSPGNRGDRRCPLGGVTEAELLRMPHRRNSLRSIPWPRRSSGRPEREIEPSPPKFRRFRQRDQASWKEKGAHRTRRWLEECVDSFSEAEASNP